MGRSKYGAVRTEVDGITFASKAEARRYAELRLLEKAGEITKLQLQPKFDIYVDNFTVAERLKASARRASLPRVKVCTYVADFAYDIKTLSASENDRYERVVEDVKGMKTPVYRLKKKLVEAQYGIRIQEIR
jgi:glutamine synthetase type III